MPLKRPCPTDPREQALKQLGRYARGVEDAAHEALRCYRATDEDAATRAAAVELCLRRCERLAKDVIDSIARLPR